MSATGWGHSFLATRWMMAIALLCVSVAASADGPGAKCDYTDDTDHEYKPDSYARIPAADDDQCVVRRGTDKFGVVALTASIPFATHCPVVIKQLDSHLTNCKEVPSALKVKDFLRIDEWPDSRFQMSLMRDGHPVFAPQPLVPLEIEFAPNNKKVVGYYTDVRLPHDFNNPGAPRDVRYVVYLMYVPDGTDMIKYYSVEVFERGVACVAEEPHQSISKSDKCTNLPRHQLPSGGGGEPPPKN